jgi:asparagine synthase (glutamine-hydrolysing)
MCGILLLHGPRANERMDVCLPRLAHRGPDERATWTKGQLCLGFCRLAINDKGIHGRQPHTHGDLVGAFNGEIYNHDALVERHGLRQQGTCDIHVVLPLVEQFGAEVLDLLDGFFSGLVFDRRTSELVTLRDHMGKKPLYVGRSGSELFVTSELKALEQVEWFAPLPKGFAKVDLQSGEVELVRGHQLEASGESLDVLLREAVRKRLPRADEPLGLFLSGGLDSSIIAALVTHHRPDAVHYTLADDTSPDLIPCALVIEALGLEHVRRVPLPGPKVLPTLIEAVVYATESYNPSIVSNGLCTYLLAQAAHADGIKVVLTGEGADELFGGYHRFTRDQPWRQTRRRLVEDMHFTELRRLDSSAMAHAVEARCPYLDRAVRAHSDTLDYGALYERGPQGLQNKVALRAAADGLLPAGVLARRKTSFDVGSGIRGLVVSHLRRRGRTEKQELEAIWRRRFAFDHGHPHFHSYPVFDHVIATRGEAHR